MQYVLLTRFSNILHRQTIGSNWSNLKIASHRLLETRKQNTIKYFIMMAIRMAVSLAKRVYSCFNFDHLPKKCGLTLKLQTLSNDHSRKDRGREIDVLFLFPELRIIYRKVGRT